MATRSKCNNQPEPWFSKKKTNARIPGQEKKVTSSTAVKEYGCDKLKDHHESKSRRRVEVEPVSLDKSKHKKSRKKKSSSAFNTPFTIPKTAVADVEELRRKREQDVVACGRTVKTVFTASKRKSISPVASGDSSEGGRCGDARTVVLSAAVPCTADDARTPTWAGEFLSLLS